MLKIASGEEMITKKTFNILVVISADVEWQVFKPLFRNITLEKTPYGECFETHLTGLMDPILFLHGGWGKIAAAGSMQYAIDRWQPKLIINLGTCGGFAGDVDHQEILLIEKTIVYDIIEQMSDSDDYVKHYTTEIDLSWFSPPYPHPVKRTLMVSGDRDLLVEEIPDLKDRFGAIAGDWESGAIAYVANRNRVKLLILRGVSDIVGHTGSQAYGNIMYFQESAEKILKYLLSNLPEWIKSCNLY
jgi:adenosylhomocysteine nucleosidase